MASIVILDTDKPVEFVDTDPANPLDETDLMTRLGTVAKAINDAQWTPAQREAFNGMAKIVFFRGAVQVGDFQMTRPGCDQPNAAFYWEVGEFLAVDHAGVRANTFFHDCWHVVQFKNDGGLAADIDEAVEREIDAVNHQIEVAQVLDCYQADLDYLRGYENDRNAIRARLAQGVCVHHKDNAAQG
jgi:hypothetical protein